MTQRRIYQNEYPYFVTAKTRDAIWLFDNDGYARLLSREIFISSKIKGFEILGFQIMPDHIHLLTNQRTLEKVRWGCVNDHFISPTERMLSSVRSGKEKQHTISDLMQSIKGNFLRTIHQGSIWQKRFYVRIVDSKEYLESVIYYIKQNPIKEKLSPKFREPPYQYFNRKLLDRLF